MNNWRRWALYITTLLVEGCWLYAVLTLVNNQAAGGRLSVIGLLALYPVAFAIGRAMGRLKRPAIARQVLSWLIWVIFLLLIVKWQLYPGVSFTDAAWLRAVPQAIADLIYRFRPELLVLVATGVIWWLGVRLASLRLNFATSVGEFQFGLIILLISLFAGAEFQVSPPGAVPLTLLFFASALLGISLAHSQEGHGWFYGMRRGQWGVFLVITVGVVIALGLLIGSLVTPDILQTILNGLKWLWGVLMSVLAFILDHLPKLGSSAPPTPPPAPGGGPAPDEPIKWGIPEPLLRLLSTGWGILMIALFAVAIWRVSTTVLEWMRRRMAGTSGAEMETIPGALRHDLWRLMQYIAWKVPGLLPFGIFRRARPKTTESTSVRQVYRQLLRWGAACGYPRRWSQTPNEYLEVLMGALPEAEVELSLITGQYVRVRYSATTPSESDLGRLKQSWHNIRQIRRKK